MNIETVIKKLHQSISAVYHDSVDRIILFGSRANGTAREYSDYDLLIIMKKDFDWRTENKILSICNEFNIEHDILIDAKILSRSELSSIRGSQPYIKEAIERGAVL